MRGIKAKIKKAKKMEELCAHRIFFVAIVMYKKFVLPFTFATNVLPTVC